MLFHRRNNENCDTGTKDLMEGFMKKIYVLDTNILVASPNALYGFKDNDIYITATTLQELDKLKNAPGETGWGAREAIRMIDSCRQRGKLSGGVDIGFGGKLYTIPDIENIYDILPLSYEKTPDNRIIATTKELELNRKEKVILVTNDISMKINASECNVEVQDYKNDRVDSAEEYTGMIEIPVCDSITNELYRNKKVDAKILNYIFIENEFLTLKSFSGNSALAIYREGYINLMEVPNLVYGVKPLNVAQKFALYALTAPVSEIPFVILKGDAGTAKTFLSLAAGLHKLDIGDSQESDTYNKILITRNNVTSDDGFGYLPGDIDEKMTPLLAPFYDNLESLIRGNTKESNEQVQLQINDFFDTGMIRVCPLAYMRGRSITHSYLIVDEAQNSSRIQMRDIITRAGKGTKIVICGDPKQIDNIHLDRYNNGLAFAANAMKGSKLCAQLTFGENESVRSVLATEALRRMKI